MTAKEKLNAVITRRDLIKPVSIGLLGLASLNLIKKPVNAKTENNLILEEVPSDLPPIIIKSGSFTIESDESLTETGSGTYNYKRMGFKLIQAVRVIKINENTGVTETFTFVDANGIEVDIRLQHYISGNWQPLAQSSLAQIKNEPVQGSSNFVLSIPKDLDKKGKPKPKRKEKREDKGNDVFRFGSVVIRGKGTVPPPTIPPTVDGDEYIIGLYNYYVENK
ncbi:MAG TPA: hypothetical protein VF556_17480 [Pyrinomonadaceae bacterium]|jgi:hypothetical protein